MQDRVPPNNVDAERAVLGAMMMPDEGPAAIEMVLGTGLSHEHFYKEAHTKTYRGIMNLVDRGEPADLLTVTKELERTRELEKVGGVPYLDEMVDSVPTAANVEYYAENVKGAAVLRRLISLTGRIQSEAYEPAAEPAKLVAELQDGISKGDVISQVAGKVRTAKEILPELLNELCASRGSEFLGLRTGFEALDKATLGLRGLSVLGGIPGQGKSSLALQLATEIARINDVPVLFYALEMDMKDLYVKTLSRLSGLDYITLRVGSEINGRRGQGLSGEETTKLTIAMGKFDEYADKVRIIDPGMCRDISLATVRLHVQQAKREYSADRVFVVIDHLQIFPCDKPGLDDMKSRLDYLIAEFKAISVQLGATVLLISEKNRESYNKPELSSFMGSAGIEYGVDLALLLHQEGEGQKDKETSLNEFDDEEDDREIELRLVKNRFGNRRKIRMLFRPIISAFFEN